MPPRKNRLPSYRLHKQQNGKYRYAVVTLTDAITGQRKDFILGKYDTPESRQAYEKIVAEWIGSGRRLVRDKDRDGEISVNEVILEYVTFAEGYYQKNGQPTKQVGRIKRSLRFLRESYGHLPAKNFGPLALKAVRERMIDSDYTRGHTNSCIACIVRMFKWAASNEFVPVEVYQSLATVDGLKQGRSRAREGKKVLPVDDTIVEACLPFMSDQVRAMVQLQRFTGMRPGEVVIMRPADIDRTGDVWTYRPQTHKTAHHGHEAIVLLGPKAQAVLKPFLLRASDSYCFSPRESRAAYYQQLREHRKSKVQPSQVYRRKKNPKRAPRDRYDVGSYNQSVARAIRNTNTARACEPCKKLKPADRCETCKAGAIRHWHVHQLRHSAATEIRKHFGLDAARAVLRHRSSAVTETYAEIDFSKAEEVAKKLG